MKTIALIALLFVISAPAFAQLPSEGFEEWEAGERGEIPVGWTASSDGIKKVESAVSGSYAVSLWSYYEKACGSIVTGKFSLIRLPFPYTLKYFGVPIDFIPAALTGYYKYVPGKTIPIADVQDSACVYVLLKRYDPEINDVDTVSFVKRLLPPSEEWIPFSIDIPLLLPGVQPDSIVVGFYSSNPDSATICAGGACSYFSVDDVALTSTSGVPYDLRSLLPPVSVLPNPVIDGEATLRFEAVAGETYRMRVHDASGSLAFEREVIGSEADLSELDLPSGAYFVSIVDAANAPIAAGRFVVD